MGRLLLIFFFSKVCLSWVEATNFAMADLYVIIDC